MTYPQEKAGLPVVALESSVIAQGLPYPINVEAGLRIEAAVREQGALPRIIGVVDGQICWGLTEEQIRYFGASDTVHKLSVRDLPIALARGLDGATTVASTVLLAASRGIDVVATGGIGGVHRPGGNDVSADLPVLARTSITLVCSGAKTLLDLPATRERLETEGITVIGYQTDEFPGFFSRSTGLAVDVTCNSVAEVTDVVRAGKRLPPRGAVLVTVPVPEDAEIPPRELEPLIAAAIAEAESAGIPGAQKTPFVLRRLAEETNGRTLQANLALLENNARVAAKLAVELAKTF